MIFDKLIVELQDQNVKFYGNLLFPNHFQIQLEEGSENLFLCLYVIKNHNFLFLNMVTNSLSDSIEFFFYNRFPGRNSLFSVVYDFKKNKNSAINSLTSLFPQTKHIENILSSVSNITFLNPIQRIK